MIEVRWSPRRNDRRDVARSADRLREMIQRYSADWIPFVATAPRNDSVGLGQ